MLIYVCLSSHGFGHAARQAAMLAQLHRLQPSWRLVVSSMVDPAFLALVLRGVPVIKRAVRWDVGMLQADALGSDQLATLQALEQLQADLPKQLNEEVAWIRAQDDQVAVLGDIPPAAAELAWRLHAPLIWMGNFGWDDIYEPLGGGFRFWAQQARDAYRKGSLLLRCPFSMAMNWQLPDVTLSLVTAEPRPLPADFGVALERDPRSKVMVGFGGLGLSLQPDLFRRWPEHLFLMAPSRQSSQHPDAALPTNVMVLPEQVRPLDVLPCCERHLGKPGFSSFCEAMSQQVGLHVVERHGFAEAEVLMKGLRGHAAHHCLSREELEAGAWKLDQPLEPACVDALASDGAQVAAEALQSSLRALLKQG